VPVDGRLYWDGLFSQNPPVRELVDAQPDEIWVIQINAKEFATEPQSSRDIADRRNELSGNLSLYQELHVIEKIDQLLEEGLLASGGRFRPIVVRIIELERSRISRSLGTVSKLNRDVDFIRELMAHGGKRADEFLAARAFEDAWRARDVDAVVDFFATDAELTSGAPFPERTVVRDKAALREFVQEQVDADVIPDLTRKQVAGDSVTWTLRARSAEDQDAIRGRAEVRFRDGKISRLSLGAGPSADAYAPS
jgi:NTE family protein